MKSLRSYLLAGFAVILVAASCSRGSDVIPRGKMAKIYAGMFLLDQQIERQRNLGHLPDTTMVYEAVFEKYGYTWENYLASRQKYMRDPERYSRIIKKSIAILTAEQRLLEDEKRALDNIRNAKEHMALFHPNRIYMLDSATFGFDFDFQEGLDTAYSGPGMTVWADTLLRQEDTAALQMPEPVKFDKDTKFHLKKCLDSEK